MMTDTDRLQKELKNKMVEKGMKDSRQVMEGELDIQRSKKGDVGKYGNTNNIILL